MREEMDGEERETSMKQQSYAMSEALVFLFGGLNALAQYRRIWTQVVVFPVPAVSIGRRCTSGSLHCFAVPFFVVLKLQNSADVQRQMHEGHLQISWDILGHATEFSDVRLEVLE